MVLLKNLSNANLKIANMAVETADSPRKINLLRIAHVYYTHKNIEKARQFLEAFGFQETLHIDDKTYYRGTGREPFVYCAIEGSEDKFGGAAFVVENAEDLDFASKTLPNATPVHELREEPGGGYRVTFQDPIDGFAFHLVHAQAPAAAQSSAHEKIKFNFVSTGNFCRQCDDAQLSRAQPNEKTRPGNEFQRFEKGQTSKWRQYLVESG